MQRGREGWMRLLHGHERMDVHRGSTAPPGPQGKSEAAALSKKVLGILKEPDSE